MTIARGELQTLSYVMEASYKNPPGTPTMLELWHNSESLAPQRAPFRSGRSLGDRQVADVRMGRKSGNGGVTSELCYANFDNLLLALICSDLAAFPTAFTPLSLADITFTPNATTGGGVMTSSGSGLVGIADGDFITITGAASAANNATWYVTSAATGACTLVPAYIGQAAMVSDTTIGETVGISQVVRVTNGTTERSLAVEAQYNDITRYHKYTGGVVNSGALTVPANGIVTMDWSFLFAAYVAGGSSLGTPAAPTAYSPFDGLSGSYLEGGIANSLMTAISLNINNNYQLTEALGSDEAAFAIPRKFAFDGNVTYYKEDDVISEKFFNETESMIQFTLTDPDSNSYTVTMPRVKYTSLAEGKGDDGPIMSRLGFESVRHPHTLFSIYVDKST